MIELGIKFASYLVSLKFILNSAELEWLRLFFFDLILYGSFDPKLICNLSF